MDWDSLLRQLAAAAVFGTLGVALFALAYFALRKCARFSIEKEIAEDQNVALGIVMGSIMLGIAIIVASAIH
jgi:putative membrane protein